MMSQNKNSTAPRYTLQIDEDGFPMFDGLRVDDKGLLRDLFENLKRQNPDDLRSTLVTSCDGELCYVDPFSTPLVAQSVSDINDESSTWIFLGGLSEKVFHRDLLQDAWGRIHCWIGKQKIGASLRSKAQAQLLNALSPSLLEELKLPPLRHTHDPVNTKHFWDQCYRNEADGWEMGGPTPVLMIHFTEIKNKFSKGAEILVPGCGRGHDAAFLNEQGLKTLCLDFSSEAIQSAMVLYGRRENLTFAKDDVFDFLGQNKSRFEGIFEHTLFCAIDPERRKEFIESVAGALKPGAFWFGIFFLRASPGGPPFGLTQWELRELTRDSFEVFDWKISPHSATPRKNQELWAVFRRRPL